MLLKTGIFDGIVEESTNAILKTVGMLLIYVNLNRMQWSLKIENMLNV